MPIKPLHDRVLIERFEDEEQKSAGGIYIPDTAKEKPIEGKVVAVGEGARSDDGKVTPPSVKVGDRVLFGKYAGTDIKYQGNEYLIMRESDILGVVTD